MFYFCAMRRKERYKGDVAPAIFLEMTHEKERPYIFLETLKEHQAK